MSPFSVFLSAHSRMSLRRWSRCLLFLSVFLVVNAGENTNKLEYLTPHVVLLKDRAEMGEVESRVMLRNDDTENPSFTAVIDKDAVFSNHPRVHGFRMLSTAHAAVEMSKDPEVLLVEPDSEISLEGF